MSGARERERERCGGWRWLNDWWRKCRHGNTSISRLHTYIIIPIVDFHPQIIRYSRERNAVVLIFIIVIIIIMHMHIPIIYYQCYEDVLHAPSTSLGRIKNSNNDVVDDRGDLWSLKKYEFCLGWLA